MFDLLKKLVGIPTQADLVRNGQGFRDHLTSLDEPRLPAQRLLELLDNEALGVLLRHAQRFPWKTDDQTTLYWKNVVQAAMYGQEFWAEYQEKSVAQDYLVFDILRTPAVSLKNFSLARSGIQRKEVTGSDGATYNYFMAHEPTGPGYALIFRLLADIATEGVLHVGTCRVFIGPRRVEGLAQWDRAMVEPNLALLSATTPHRPLSTPCR